MAKKQVAVNLREARLFEQWLNTTLASAKWADILQFSTDKDVILGAYAELSKSQLYHDTGKSIEDKANEIVNVKCKPEWERISKEMKKTGERINELEKEKAGGNWDNEKETELENLHKKMPELTDEYQKVTDEANKELNDFKEDIINNEKGCCFFLSEKDYNTVGGYCGWILPTEDK